jgi:hypothetical protein
MKQRIAERLNLLFLVDIITSTGFWICTPLNWIYRRYGGLKLKRTTRTLNQLSSFFSLTEYYEGLDFRLKDKYSSATKVKRPTPKILKMNTDAQLNLLEEMATYNKNLFVDHGNKDAVQNSDFLIVDRNGLQFFESFILHFKPGKIIEIGSGLETVVSNRILRTYATPKNLPTNHVIYDYQITKSVKNLTDVTISPPSDLVNLDWEKSLHLGDLLIVHASNIYPPGEERSSIYKEFIPKLNSGVTVLIIDVFSSLIYEDAWVRWQINSWSECDMLEILLTNTNRYEVVALLNYLKENFPHELEATGIDMTVDCGDIYFRII